MTTQVSSVGTAYRENRWAIPAFREHVQLVDRFLSGYIDKQVSESPAQLVEAMRYCLLAPGKRLRPILTMAAAKAVGGNVTDALPAGAAIEMIHAYSLVHDDLPAMDDDDLRRGQPTCHRKYGEATAILVGDGLLTLAFQVLSECLAPARLAVDCIAELSQAAGILGMVGGQMDDFEWENRTDGQLAELQSIHRRKTGALFRAALRMGGVIGAGGADNLPVQQKKCLNGYAHALGMAFQISDDLLDAEGDSELTGKRVNKDHRRGKLTYPTLLGVEESRNRLRTVCAEAIQYAEELGSAGSELAALARFVGDRNH